MNEYVNDVMKRFGPGTVSRDGVAIPDEEEEMNWRIFFAHSQDMQGFRADIFTGGQNEENHPTNTGYRGLRDRWSDSKSMMRGLAALWENADSQTQLRHFSNRFRSNEEKVLGVRPCVEVLRGPAGNEATRTFADAVEDLSGYKIARSTNSMIRSYIQNSALLKEYGFSFRNYLLGKAPGVTWLAKDIVWAEKLWIRAIEREFYNVGPALANYMICDWLLRLWKEGQIQWFESYKEDSVFLKTLGTQGKLPPEAVTDFIGYCQNLSMLSEWLPGSFADRIGWPTPPRILNEAIWLGESEQSKWKKC